MPLQATSGAASYDAFGGGVPVIPNYIEDVFSTWLYKGNSSTQTINNGVDLASKGGMVWLKVRDAGGDNYIRDTARGGTKLLTTNSTASQDTTDAYPDGNGLRFDTTGFSLGPGGAQNSSSFNYASWTFRKQPKFFDVVTWTGNGANRTIAHNLGSVPGCIIVKRTDTTGDWQVYHRSLANTQYLVLNGLAAAATGATRWNSTTPTSTVFSLGTDTTVNASGGTYVAYIYAHDAGGFGLSGTDNVISCGSYTGNGSSTGPSINLGYEPQWVMIKNASAAGGWVMADNMRGLVVGGADPYVMAQSSNAEDTAFNFISPTATGFDITTSNTAINGSGNTVIYIAIRRGPMKVPTTGTSVFYPQTVSQANNIDSTGVPFPPDLVNTFSRNGTNRAVVFNQFQFVDRLRGLGIPSNFYAEANEGVGLVSSSTGVEYGRASNGTYVQLKADGQNITRSTGWSSSTYGNWIYYFMRRAPGFFDVVCYTGTGGNRTVAHNLAAVPELMIVKGRSNATAWQVYSSALANTQYLALNTTTAVTTGATRWNSTTPTSSVFSLGTASEVNTSGATYVAYLFACCPGVSKVGSYTGTGTTQVINCGFTAGSRFVLIRRTDTTGNWYVWDTARGMIPANDPYLLLNSTNAEITSTDYVDTTNVGFEITSTAPAAINASGGTYIFLAIA